MTNNRYDAAALLQFGRALYPSIIPALQPWSDELGIALPRAL